MVEARKCLEVNENHWIPLYALTFALVQRGDLAGALQAAEKGVHFSRRRASHVGLLARVLAQRGEINRAEQLLEDLRTMAPAGLFWYHLLGGEVDAAADYYAKMIAEEM